MGFEMTGTAFAVVALVVAFIAVAAYAASRLKTVKPDQALVVIRMGSSKLVDGVRVSSGDDIVFAGKRFVLPLVQEAFTLELKQRQVALNVTGPDMNFINVTVTGSLNFKFDGTVDGVRKASQRFLNHNDEELERSMQNALEGSLRAIVGSMTVQEINSDRPKFMSAVLRTAKAELAEQGIHVDTLNIRDIRTDDDKYWRSLSAPEVARATQVAAVAESESKIVSERARISQETKTAEMQKDLDLRKADFDIETSRREAEAAAAGERARAEQDVEVARLERIATEERAKVTEQELDISVKKPAEAAAYKQVKEAEAARDANKADAEAEAYGITKKADAEAAATIKRGKAEAEKIEAIGKANGAAEEAQAAALAKMTPEALTYLLVNHLPAIMESNAQAVAGIDSYTVISTDGASDATKQAGRMFSEGIATLSAATGIDFGSALATFAGARAAVAAAPAPEIEGATASK